MIDEAEVCMSECAFAQRIRIKSMAIMAPRKPTPRAEQIETVSCSPMQIMHHPNFERGLADIREGRAFDDAYDDLWAYERARLFGAIAPRSMPLFDRKGYINLKAAKLFAAAVKRKLIP
jgi:hypothetical protein